MSALDEAIEGAIAEFTDPQTETTEIVNDVEEVVNPDIQDVDAEAEDVTEVVSDDESVSEEEPKEPVKKLPDSIPYDRFAEVVHQRNQYEEMLKQTLMNQQQIQPGPDIEDEPEEPEPVWESDGEKLLYQMVSDLKAQNQQLAEMVQAREQQTLIQSVAQEFNATLETLGGNFAQDDVDKLVAEASKYESVPGMTVAEATKRAYFYLSGTNSIAPRATAPTTKANPLRVVTSAKSQLANGVQQKSAAPKQEANLEAINTLDEALAFALRAESQ